MTSTVTPIICGECGRGIYEMEGTYGCCTVCGHEVETNEDVLPYLDEGESLIVRNGVLFVVGA